MRAEEMKNCVSVVEILSMYGIEVKKRIPCPIHGGVKNNFAVHDNNFKCFSCGEEGDIFNLVQCLSHVDFMEAYKLICEYFSLSYSQDSTKRKQCAPQMSKAKQSIRIVRAYQERRIYHALRHIRSLGGNNTLESHLEGLLDRFNYNPEFYLQHDIHAHIQAILHKNSQNMR